MHRTTIMLPRALKAKAARLAKERGVSLGQYIREAVERSVGESGRQNDAIFNPTVLPLDDGPTDMAARHDDYLYGEREA